MPLSETPGPTASSGSFTRHYVPHLLRGLTDRVSRKLRRGRRPFYWQTGYRLIDGPGVADTGRLDGAPFIVLPDDGKRFYADPFVFEHDGRHYLFVEEFPYATGRGVISVAERDEHGRFGVPRIVLSEPHHLSYPQIVTHGGEIYLIPESSAAHQLVLYRAEAFPDRWVRDTVLLDGIDFNDATLLETPDGFWLFGTERLGQGGPSDTMAIYMSPSLRGPWTPHLLNPIVIDHSAARPGGAFIHNGGKLLLPVQDGSRAYGGGLGLMEMTGLDAGDVVFKPPVPVKPWPSGRSIHTLNRVGALEVVDWSG